MQCALSPPPLPPEACHESNRKGRASKKRSHICVQIASKKDSELMELCKWSVCGDAFVDTGAYKDWEARDAISLVLPSR